MGKWKLIWPFWAIMVVHIIGILIFTKGFLLTRTELPFYSNCSDISKSPCFATSSSANLNQCWTKPAVDRVVIIILDALRFDFVAPSTFFGDSKPWMDKLPVLNRMTSTRGSSAKIFKAIADPPTTSLQRLKGLTTGGLPTFIDVGNSFGAPAIVEDNLIHQLVQNGKRVVMMGDDTWMQLFPHHFKKSFPYPSFNVKDLHTVDNGCIEHLLPSLREDNWDVLISHFLGVDHAGHIFGVDSIPMIEKLEQYNAILEKVIDELESQSGPGGLHENTLLLVMGDHGQTMNGDHGGGSPEEVETSLFAMSFKKPSASISHEFSSPSCQQDLDKREMCISSIQQLDFPATVSALLGVPFPFGSIGRVDPELYAVGAGTWDLKSINSGICQNLSKLEQWMQNYANVLCINSWQVKRYLDVYSTSSVIGFSHEDLLHINDKYDTAMANWSCTMKNLSTKHASCHALLPVLKMQINAYSEFLASVVELARSKWTEFNLKMMSIGFGVMLVSLLVHFLAIKRTCGVSFPSSEDPYLSFGLVLSCFLVAMRAFSFLSNSYILEEGKVASFLLATTGIVKLRYSLMKKNKLFEAMVFLLLMIFCRSAIEVGLSKQAATSAFLKVSSSWVLGIAFQLPDWMSVTEALPITGLILLAYLLYKTVCGSNLNMIWKFVISGTITSYILTGLHWALENNTLYLSPLFEELGKNFFPRIIYVVGLGQLLLLTFSQLFIQEKSLVVKTVAMLSTWSSTVIILAGKQGPMVALASILGGYCIIKLHSVEKGTMNASSSEMFTGDLFPVMQWGLLAVSLFFCSGHWCAFDGLRYGAAFIGFDEFVLFRQAILLAIDTFGFSHILPLFGLPLLIANKYKSSQADKGKKSYFLYLNLARVYLMYGLIMSTTVTATILCVIIHRRHLMVWGLFAPKFVFDVVSLILTDVLICFAMFYYVGNKED